MAAPIPLMTAEARVSTKAKRLSLIDPSTLSVTAQRNTLKEALVLEYAANFQAQFRELYPERRPLLLCPLNEGGVRKFVCTSLRPAPPPSRELYEAAACARFLAQHVA